MIERTLTEEQRAIVEATQSSLIVTAAAGAGKTLVLVERYLRHVLTDGLSPNQILTITFTKKAAAEMKKRIVSALRNAGRLADAQAAETGPVQTIHSFCERLLRENALEAGLDPAFEITSEGTSSRMVIRCIREVLASSLDEDPYAESLVAFLAGQRRFGGRKSPYAMLETAVESVLRELRSSGFSQLEIRQWHDSPSSLKARWEEAILSELPPEVAAVLANTEGGLRDRLQIAFKSATNKVPTWLKGKEDADAESDALAHACGLVQLACNAWWRLDYEMERERTLDFTELEARANRLMARSPITQARVREQYAVVMVDEAQDVNPIQHDLLQNLGIAREMLVGDDQQSIYGFRQAEPELFQQRVGESSLSLTKNWRSTDGILAFVDLVFASIWGGRYRKMSKQIEPMDFDLFSMPAYDGVEIWRQQARDASATASYIRELINEGVQPGEIAILVRNGTGGLDAKRGLDQEGIECRIAGGSERFYTRIEVRDLANALRAVADPYDDFALLACLRSPMAGISLDAIALLGMQRPVVEHLADFESPVADDASRLAAFRSWYEPLRGYADRLSAWEVLSEIFAQSEYLPALARRDNHAQLLANVRKLLTLAAQEPELGPLDYADRIREIQDLQHKEGDAPAGAEDANVVTIMTIHKAKGLEFDVVVLPQTHLPVTGRARELAINARTGLTATKFGKGESLFYKFMTEEKKQRDFEEELRVLYVALTRARKRLCVCLYPPSPRDTVSKRLSQAIGDGHLPGVVIRDSAAVANSQADL